MRSWTASAIPLSVITHTPLHNNHPTASTPATKQFFPPQSKLIPANVVFTSKNQTRRVQRRSAFFIFLFILTDISLKFKCFSGINAANVRQRVLTYIFLCYHLPLAPPPLNHPPQNHPELPPEWLLDPLLENHPPPLLPPHFPGRILPVE